MAVGAMVGRGGRCEEDGGTGWHGGRLWVVAGEGYGCENELAAALGNEAGESGSCVGSAEFDDVEVAIELFPGVGEDASACVGFVASVFGAIGTCLALCDDTLGGFGDGKCAAVGIRRGGRRSGGIGCQETFGLFESFSGHGEVLAEGLGFAIACREEEGELGIGLCGYGAIRGRGGHGDEGGGGGRVVGGGRGGGLG